LSAFDGRGARRGREREGISSPVEVDTLEAISPELVLVDPVLRRRALAQLNQAPTPDVLARPAPVAEPRPDPVRPPDALPPAPAPKRFHALRVASALLPAALVFGVVVALAASEIRSDGPSIAPTAPTSTATTRGRQSLRPASTSRERPKSPTPRRRAAAQESRRVVERKLLELVVRAPEGKLPRALIDPASGLARNGLQAVCRSSRPAGSFFCVIRSSPSPTTRVYVRYRRDKDGRGSFTWLPRPRG
jgi:hypothetical protein